ncbi:caspase, EACC1-associated type [Dolichospermum circinale]|uniref:caspase, EACC1-associated type n=1 Tax=Dolichospermum circinale TaxID=109265 RepID=UPI00232F5DDA|nr:SUMF1/EgtB/PvdO family nonheme iron enzyme [Dolichospermum circinale]MDB9456276.1 SUMF1/EgtB/PvdO family nonheme iron enzyme [Dolichospermum circinale CS-541/06]MDB9461969.1 SUMF1/EgtB/PvdO family nonheme iron enzyme [Dolichospermum circinale CS-541/04]
MNKFALLIGVSEYQSGFSPLPTTVKDVEAIQEVLVNPEIGEFAAENVTVLKNPQKPDMEEAIHDLYDNRQRDDLLLLYFSGHGLINDDGNFYFSTSSTKKKNASFLPYLAVAASYVHECMKKSKSKRKVVILDSCFSGAFSQGMTAKDGGAINIKQHLGGQGTAILTASTSTQYAYEEEGSEFGIYTRYLVDGIKTGAADKDGDGSISIDELHEYVSSKVQEVAPAMTPKIYPVEEGHRIILAKSPQDDPNLKYRKEVEEYASEDEGEISLINRQSLNVIQKKLGLTIDIAQRIEAEVLEPYQKRQEKSQTYEKVFCQSIEQEYPISERSRKQLQRLQNYLNLRDEDIASIERKILDTKQVVYSPPSLNNTEPEPEKFLDIPVTSFKFETAKLILKSGVFGLGKSSEIQRITKNANYFGEDLGNGVILEMVAIPGGTFKMGSPENEEGYDSSQSPQHEVTVPPFFMGKYPVTQKQWRVVAALPKVKIDLQSDPSRFKGDNLPVERVSWNDAKEFCARLSRMANKTYRLPTEAEWEYACRGGTTTPFYCGETISTDLANYNGNYTYGQGQKGQYREKTTEVGIFPANPFGLYDMCGNVWELCEDDWQENYINAPKDGSAWTSLSVNKKLLRGGSWFNDPEDCRSAYRYYNDAGFGFNNSGFRVVCGAAWTH